MNPREQAIIDMQEEGLDTYFLQYDPAVVAEIEAFLPL